MTKCVYRWFVPSWLACAAVLAACGACGGPGVDGGPRSPVDAGPPPTPGERAVDLVNQVRGTAGVPALTRSVALEQAAQAHADYFAAQPDAYAHGESPHGETPAIAGFTGASFDVRDGVAGFTGSPFFEVMDFVDDPARAVPDWLNSVFHRVPLVHPDTTELGYGAASVDGRAVDVMDFGRGPENASLASVVVVFPPDGATGVPPSFAGNEGPQPPAPPAGYPSGPIASVLFNTGQRVVVTHHEMFDASGASLGHTMLTPDDPQVGALLVNSIALYADAPAPAGSVVRIAVDGTVGLNAFSAHWSFTVQ